MKKYQRLLLLIVSITSLSLFLVYRHEYNRLHYVLEVFNFFGQSCNFSDLQNSDYVLSHHDWGPQPVWQETEYGYVYSAFLTRKLEARAIALQDSHKNVPRNCYFWFEDKKKSVMGKFKFSKIASDEKVGLASYFYYCSLSSMDTLPYALSFSYKAKKDSDMKKVLLTNSLEQRLTINTTICVAPSIFSKKRFLEFLSFHKLLGVDMYIFYIQDIPHKLSKIISNLSNRLTIHTTYLSWNFPKGDSPLARSIVENDCLLRSTGQSKYIITLDLNEYIVPTTVHSLDSLLKEVDVNSDRISLPIQKFCIDNLAMNKPIALQNFEVVDDSSFNAVRYIYKKQQTDDVISTEAVHKASGSINKYVKCNVYPQKTYRDNRISRYSTDFIRSTLVQLLIHNKI